MLRNFFASPNFLGLLKFWDASRNGRKVPDWDGDLARIPAELLPRLIVVDRDGALRYRHIGSELAAGFSHDPTGQTIAETLSPGYAAYISDIIERTLTNGNPIFSASVLHRQSMVKMTGRLVAPFTVRGARRPSLIMSAHLMGGDAFKVTEVVEPGGVIETQRLMIAGVPDLCARLDEAGRYHRLSHLTTDRALARKWDAIATSLGSCVLVPLEAFHVANC
jgi:hypothetical protein